MVHGHLSHYYNGISGVRLGLQTPRECIFFSYACNALVPLGGLGTVGLVAKDSLTGGTHKAG